MEDVITVPKILTDFILTVIFSLLIGLSQRRLHKDANDDRLFGTDRTFTFIGILSFLLYQLDPAGFVPFLAGGIILSSFLVVYYINKIKEHRDFGLTTILIALITYSFIPMLITQPFWLYLLVIVTVLIFTELKESLTVFTLKFEKEEFITLGKFLVIAGVILPMVPDTPIVSYLSITPYKIWLAVVVISSISYVSYLLKKFVFKNTGIIVSGILGGLYSSTATTIVLARKSRDASENAIHYVVAIILATAIMYLRILLLAYIFNVSLFHILSTPLIILFLVSVMAAVGLLLFRKKGFKMDKVAVEGDKNPLEFKIALLFTILYIAFTFITYYTITNFGTRGLSILSYVVGVTDIDPFLINLFQGRFNVNFNIIAISALQAMVSNNVLKLFYAWILSSNKHFLMLVLPFLVIIVTNLLFILLMN